MILCRKQNSGSENENRGGGSRGRRLLRGMLAACLAVSLLAPLPAQAATVTAQELLMPGTQATAAELNTVNEALVLMSDPLARLVQRYGVKIAFVPSLPGGACGMAYRDHIELVPDVTVQCVLHELGHEVEFRSRIADVIEPLWQTEGPRMARVWSQNVGGGWHGLENPQEYWADCFAWYCGSREQAAQLAQLAPQTYAVVDAVYHSGSGQNLQSAWDAGFAWFRDADPYAWYGPELALAAEDGLVSGDGDGFFRPQQDLSRAEAVTLVRNIYTISEQPADGLPPDVPRDGWYAQAAAWTLRRRMVPESWRERFGGGEAITRAEFAYILYRDVLLPGTGGRPESLDEFSDAGEIPAEFRDAMAWAVDAGLMRGDGRGRLMPLEPLSRAEAAALVLRHRDLMLEQVRNR